MKNDNAAQGLPVLAEDLMGYRVRGAGKIPVVTASELSEKLDYAGDRAVRKLLERNPESFRDGGTVDFTRRAQNGPPCSLPDDQIDTFIALINTPGRADGLGGGGVQGVRVFTERGALKICMKSNQPKAVAVQEALIDLFQKVRRGDLVDAQIVAFQMATVLERITGSFEKLLGRVENLESRPAVSFNLPNDSALPVSLERQRRRRPMMGSGLRYAEVRDMVIRLCRDSMTYKNVAKTVAARWPENPEMHVSKSSIGRFWDAARRGLLKELGIDSTVH